MRAKLWGVRGSAPVPGPATERFGGNTSCVQVTADNGSEFVLDAGTGIRALGAALAGRRRRLHVLLTHLHLDHIQGLMFFAPFFDREVEIAVWGPPLHLEPAVPRSRSVSIPACVSFRDVPPEPWRIGSVEVRAELVSHRGPTLGYRLSENGTSLCYLPDHGPALGQDLATAPGALDLGTWARPRRLPSDPRQPVLRGGVPRASRLGPFEPPRGADLRPSLRRWATAALPP